MFLLMTAILSRAKNALNARTVAHMREMFVVSMSIISKKMHNPYATAVQAMVLTITTGSWARTFAFNSAVDMEDAGVEKDTVDRDEFDSFRELDEEEEEEEEEGIAIGALLLVVPAAEP